MLYERLAPDTVRWGYKLKDYTEDLKVSEVDKPITLRFDDEREEKCDLLVGADGIHSIVRKLRDLKEKEGGLRYLEVGVILGTSTAQHPLLDARGIYIVSGSSRLFTMPFRPATFNPDGTILEPQQTMWQLSFACADESESRRIRSSTPEEMMSYALKLTEGWIEPVKSLIAQTPLSEVWSTPLYDREPMRLRSKERASLVTVAGDAAHPMSMFKGQHTTITDNNSNTPQLFFSRSVD